MEVTTTRKKNQDVTSNRLKDSSPPKSASHVPSGDQVMSRLL
jgi:hypothetical protein